MGIAPDILLRTRKVGGFLIATGLAWSSFIGIHKVLFSVRTDSRSAVALLLVGGLLSALGFLPVPASIWTRNHRPRQMLDGDMAHLFLLLQTFGPTSPLTSKLEVLKKNPKCFVVVECENAGAVSVVGYFIAYRLTLSAVNRLRSGELKGHSMTAKDVVPANRRPHGLYVSLLWGRNYRAKGEALLIAKKEIRAALSKVPSLTVFARVGTKDSLRLLRKYEFLPIHSSRLEIDSIAYREMAANSLHEGA